MSQVNPTPMLHLAKGVVSETQEPAHACVACGLNVSGELAAAR